jgi:hypothetical protein
LYSVIASSIRLSAKCSIVCSQRGMLGSSPPHETFAKSEGAPDEAPLGGVYVPERACEIAMAAHNPTSDCGE